MRHKDDLISRQAAIDILMKHLDDDKLDGYVYLSELKELPAIQPKQKTGQWIAIEGYDLWKCSECKELFMLLEGTPKNNLYNYCPNCGARMEDGQ